MNTTQSTNLTPQQKAAETRRRRKKQEFQSLRDSSADLPTALMILRRIRDDPASTGLEKILAIKLLTDISK